MKKQSIKAKFKPKSHDNLSNVLIKEATEDDKPVFDWKFAFRINGIPYYETNDIRFPSTDAFRVTDLEITE